MKQIWTIFLVASAVRAADVTLWMNGQAIVDNPVRCVATYQATRMFTAIGVSLEWVKAMPTAPEGTVIEVRFTAGVPGQPGAMAFSTPFDARPVITVMYDRIRSATEGRREYLTTLLAHVLAHEIGHILMRSEAHSPDGVMKAHWTASDYGRMIGQRLPFLPGDEDSIRRGLASFAALRVQRVGSGIAASGHGRGE